MDQCVPDVNGPVHSPEWSPVVPHKQKPSVSTREIKTPIKVLDGETRRFKSSSAHSPSNSPRILGIRSSPSCSEDDSDQENKLQMLAKRRKLNYDTPNYTPSPCHSPVNMSQEDTSLNADASICEKTPNTSQLDAFFSQFTNSTDTSNISTPAISPSTSVNSFQALASQKCATFRGRYKKDELWPVIQEDYQFLMDEEIIETCKSTESDLSWESDDVTNSATTVSFNEFLQQYNELTDWLTHIQSVTQRQSSSLSEKYLNQTYHEEMLQGSPRRKLFNDYAKQLMRRYPNRKEEIQLRLQHLNKQWEALENAISPNGGYMDEKKMYQDLEQDLDGLCKWLHEIEEHLQPLALHPDWTTRQLEIQLHNHKALQHDLDAHSKTVSAILKLCERLDSAKDRVLPESATNKKLLASNLEHRWHTILLQSLEWQCRLEEAIKNGIKKRPVIECPSSPESDDNQSAYASYTTDQSTICYQNTDHRTAKELNENGVDSDNSNFDVIPFSESEYEKIAIDTDVQTDENLSDTDEKVAHSSSVTIPQREIRTRETCDRMERGGTDSALGRSVSDHSINTEQRTTSYYIKLSHVKQALNEAVASKEPVAMRSGQEAFVLPKGSPMQTEHNPICLRLENNDFGYSSETHSNEEQDWQHHGDGKGAIIQHESHPVPAGPENVQKVNLRVPCAQTADSTWRHSVTSAYDTSSNCSDPNNSADDRERRPNDGKVQGSLLDEFSPENKVTALLSSPNQDFYQMTTIETDSEATSTGNRPIIQEESRSGAATDADSELSRSLELPYDDTPIVYTDEGPPTSAASTKPSAKTRLDALFENIEPLESPVGSPESLGQVVPSDGDQSMDEESVHPVSDSGESNALFEMEGFNNSVEAIAASGGRLKSQATDCTDLNLELHACESSTHDSLSRLFHQAHLLTRESSTALHSIKPCRTGSKGDKGHRTKQHKGKCAALNQSFTSTDGSAVPKDAFAPSAHSTCEASSESTSESSSESDEEFSSTSSASEAEDASCDGLPLEVSGSLGVTLCANLDNSSSTLGDITRTSSMPLTSLRRTKGKARLQSLSSSGDLDKIQYSVSEGALNDLKMYTSQHKLRRTISDMPIYKVPSHSTPRRMRRRRIHRGQLKSIPCQLMPSPVKQFYSQSLPSSRLHSSRSCSRSLSPDSLNLGSTDIQTTVLEREGQSQKAIKETGRLGTETDDDAVHQSLTSAAEFSENAWDNLHHIYPYISSDPGEEKLDASEFQKDWDFHNCCSTGYVAPPSGDDKNLGVMASSGEKIRSRAKDKRLNSSKLSATQSYLEDSDSDLEDIHYVITESYKAIKFTETTLRKFRKDNMDTGIFIDPSEYDGPLETCKEHIVCLEDIQNALRAKTGPDMDLVEIQEISDMISKWEALWHLACERQKQSQCLASIYQELVGVKSFVQNVSEELDKTSFDSINELKQSLNVLQEYKTELRNYSEEKVPQLVERLTDFESRYPDLKIQRFDEEIARLQHSLETAIKNLTARSSELQNVLLSWYDFGETHRELEYLLAREKCHLSCLEGNEDIITKLFSLEDLNFTIHDLQALDTEMSQYEAKLEALHTLQREIAKVYKNSEADEHLQHLEKLFHLLRSKCHSMAAKIQTRLERVDKQTQAALETAIDAKLSSIAEQDSLVTGSDCTSLLWRLMKIALPVQIAIVMGFCLLCLYDPAYCESIKKFNLIFSPHLSYVNGPPPM